MNWKLVQKLEGELRDAEILEKAAPANTATLTQSKINTNAIPYDAESIRLRLLELYEDMLISDHQLVSMTEYSIEERIWKLIFYDRIEDLRGTISKYLAERNKAVNNVITELTHHLDMAEAFYKTFILQLKCYWNFLPIPVAAEIYFNKLNTDAIPSKSLMQTFIYKCYIYLGDLARYRTAHCSSGEKNWTYSEDYYKYAARINPEEGKSFSQLAILSTYQKNNLDTVFWYSLSLSNQNPLAMAQENLNLFYAKISKQPIPIVNSDTFIYHLINYHRQIVFVNDDALCQMDNSCSSAINLQSAVVSSFQSIISEIETSPDLCLSITKTFVILISSYHSMDTRFLHSQTTPVLRQKIRNVQVLLLSLLFDLTEMILHAVNQFYLQHTSENLFHHENKSPTVAYLGPLGIVFAWISTNFGVFKLFVEYTSPKKPLEGMRLKIMKWSKALANFANTVSSFADLDSSSDAIEDDIYLLGFKPLLSFYKNLDPDSVKSVLQDLNDAVDPMMVRMSRIGAVAKMLSEDKTMEFFIFDSKGDDAGFVVMDEETKRIEKQKLSKVFALELLKTQIDSMETSLEKIKEAIVPFVILDTDVYLYHLHLIKSMLMMRSCVIVITLDVMYCLDNLKKGTEKVNIKAREAIRYLEQKLKFKSKYLKAQQETEKLQVWDRYGIVSESEIDTGCAEISQLMIRHANSMPDDMNEHGHDNVSGEEGVEKRITVHLPKEYQHVLSCALFYQKNMHHPSLGPNDLGSAIVSDDPDLSDFCRILDVCVLDVKEWRSRLLKSKKR